MLFIEFGKVERYGFIKTIITNWKYFSQIYSKSKQVYSLPLKKEMWITVKVVPQRLYEFNNS